jgi:hypothetical protein
MQHINKIKKYNSQHLLNKRRLSRINYKFRPNLKKLSKHGGGIIGAFKHWNNMRKFNNFINKFTKSKENLKEEYESFKAESKFYMNAAKEKAKHISDLLTATKINAIYKLKDESGLKKKNPVLVKQIEKNKKFSKGKMDELTKKIKRLNYDNSKNRSEFNRMNTQFNKKIKHFESVMKDKVNITDFLQKVKNLYEKYADLKGIKEEKLSKKHKKLIKEFELNKENFKKVHGFTESYFNKTNDKFNDYMRLRRQAEFYNNQFNDKNISDFSKDLKSWEDEIKEFYVSFEDCNEQGNNNSKKYKEWLIKLNSIAKRFDSISERDKKDNVKIIIRLVDACLKHQNEINDLVTILKIRFFENEPAIRLQWNSNLIFAKAILINKALQQVSKRMAKLKV